jgi:hypothetical protein
MAAAPCDPNPENGIIVVCSVLLGDDERVFPGAPCWYTDAPTTRKRGRNDTERDDKDRTFVTTVYSRGSRRFAGICISQPHVGIGVVAIGVAISGAINVARPNPAEGEPDLDVPDPGSAAFFTIDGKFQFGPFDAAQGPPEDPAASLKPLLIRYLRSVLPPTTEERSEWKLDGKAIVCLVKIFCIQTNELRQADAILREFFDDPDREKGFIKDVCRHRDDESDGNEEAFETLDPETEILVSYVCTEGLRAQGHDYDREAVRQELRTLYDQRLELINVPVSVTLPWGRVLDTGSGNTVRVLLKL